MSRSRSGHNVGSSAGKAREALVRGRAAGPLTRLRGKPASAADLLGLAPPAAIGQLAGSASPTCSSWPATRCSTSTTTARSPRPACSLPGTHTSPSGNCGPCWPSSPGTTSAWPPRAASSGTSCAGSPPPGERQPGCPAAADPQGTAPAGPGPAPI